MLELLEMLEILEILENVENARLSLSPVYSNAGAFVALSRGEAAGRSAGPWCARGTQGRARISY